MVSRQDETQFFRAFQRKDIAESLQHIEEITTGQDLAGLEEKLKDFIRSANRSAGEFKKSIKYDQANQVRSNR